MIQKTNFLEEGKGEGALAEMVTLWQHQHILHAGQKFNKNDSGEKIMKQQLNKFPW